MGLFDKEKIANLANKTLEKSKQVAQFAAEKANEQIEIQKKKNKNVFPNINNDIPNSKVLRFYVAGEYYSRDDIVTLGEHNPNYSMNKTQLVKADHWGLIIEEYIFDKDYEVTLEYEPKNKYDPNAIMVLFNGVKVGYIAKNETAEVRQLIKQGIVGIDGVIEGSAKKVLLRSKEKPNGFVQKESEDFNIRILIAMK